MQAIIYVRFSTMEQREGVSIDRQLERCTAFSQSQAWDIESALIDEGKSAFAARHREAGAAFATFEAEARAGIHAGKVLVVERLSRLSRELPHRSYDLMRAMVDNNVWLAVADGGRIYKSAESIDFMETIEFFLKAKMANDESQVKRDMGRDKWERRRRDAREGRIVTKTAPPWLTLTGDRQWQIVDDRAALVRRIFAEADAGDGALRIARRLNEDGVPPWPRYANRVPQAWDRRFVHRIMTNVAVIGDYVMNQEDEQGRARPSGEPVRGYYPRIVDPDLFERVNAASGDRLAVKGGRSSVVSHIASGLTVCADCGSKMEYVRSRAKGKVVVRKGQPCAPLKQETGYLYCRTANRRGACTNRSGIAYVGFERALLDSALHLALDDNSFARTDEIGRLSILLADRRRDQAAAIGKATALWEGYAASQSDIAMKLAMKAEADARLIADEVAGLERAKAIAAGATSAAEQLGRLAEVRSQLYEDDLEVRRVQRLKVATGLRAVIERIECRADRRVDVFFKHALRVAFIYPGAGRRPPRVATFNLAKPGRSYAHLDPQEQLRVEAYLRRNDAEGHRQSL